MKETTRIEVDIEVYRSLLANIKSFDETPNSVLRRILRVEGGAAPAATPGRKKKVGRPAVAKTAAAPKKRGRKPGRPKGAKNKTTAKTTAAAAPKKPGRKPGRPKGSTKKATAATAAPKKPGRKPGRPKGSTKKATAATAAPKKPGRKPGRPKGSTKKATTATAAPKKRGRKPSKAIKNVGAPRQSSNYYKLYEALQSAKGNSVEYTFDQVEKIIGSKLPDSAVKFPAWWSNNTTGHRKSWLAAGYKVDGIDLDKKKVNFSK